MVVLSCLSFRLTDRPSPVLADRMPCGMEGLDQGAVSRVATGDVDGCDGAVAHRVRAYLGRAVLVAFRMRGFAGALPRQR